MRIYQNTSAAFDLAANNPDDLSHALEANECFAKLASAQGSHQHCNNLARRDLELEPADLDWAMTCSGEWEATDPDLGMVYRVTECVLH